MLHNPTTDTQCKPTCFYLLDLLYLQIEGTLNIEMQVIVCLMCCVNR